MTSRTTLLAHLAYKFSPQPETVATEALGHILRSSDESRNSLREFLLASGVDTGRINNVSTEVSGESLERPDLSCMDEDGRERILIELKFWAGMTDNQPGTYLTRLPDDRPSALLVIAPSSRLETLWPQVRDPLDEFPVHGEGASNETRWVSLRDERRLILTSWSSVLEGLTSAVQDEQSSEDIRQLRGLVDQQDSEAFLPLGAEQLSPETPRLILNLSRLVDDASARIFDTTWAERGRMQKRWEGGPFQYLTVSDLSTWFGVNYYHWKQYEITPLWLGFQPSAWEHEDQILNCVQTLRHQDPPRYMEEEGIIPIRLKTRTEYGLVLDDVVKQLKEIAQLLQGVRA